MTGLYNRRFFDIKLSQLLKIARAILFSTVRFR
nr:hypothetical protein [Aeromonas allosaccharophila]